MASQPPPEAKLLDKFSDGISTLEYLKSWTLAGAGSTNRLASTSWDGNVRLHDTSKETSPVLLSHNMESGPLLSLAIPFEVGALVTGGLDGCIRKLDIETTTVQTIGRHEQNNKDGNPHIGNKIIQNACSCLKAMNGNHPHLLASASWNQQLCIWDLRQSKDAVAQENLPGKAFSMDVDTIHGRILVATSGRRNIFYDLRKGEIRQFDRNVASARMYTLQQVLERESSLKFQTRCVKFFPDGHAFCVGSIEGRVGVEFLDELQLPSNDMKKYAFKCHRVGETVYPVNAVDFHPKYETTFATGGCDGTVVLWDGIHKKKLTALPAFPTSIAALAFAEDGNELAIASSYTHEEGDREHPQDEIYVRKILDNEAMPKTK